MKKQIFLTGFLLILAAITFWISWFLMPDPGTADTVHILKIVKQSRTSVFYSVVIQICSAVLYINALLLLVRISFPQTKTLAGIALFGIGAMGLCADAFFHLLAWFMTDNSVNIQEDVITVMKFMQTDGLIFLIPLLLPFFIGSLIMVTGLRKQKLISRIPEIIIIAALIIGVAGAIITNTILKYKGPGLSLTVLGIFAVGQVFIGFELMNGVKKEKKHLEAISPAIIMYQKNYS